MPVPANVSDSSGSVWWLIAVVVASFVVSWLAGNRLHLTRTSYIAVLALATAALAGGYFAWIDVDLGTVLAANWAWGLVGGVVAGAITAFAITRMPATLHRHGIEEGVAYAWEGVVYGIAEGVLLSALPAFITWQAIHAAGWSGLSADVALWALPLLASVAVIIVHHLGYWEYRNWTLVPITVACSVLTVAFLVTGSVLAPVLGHVIMHAAAIGHGNELPPHPHLATPQPTTG
jgi:hypothetical protein